MHLGVRHPRVLILLLIGLTGLFAGRAAHSEPHALPIVGSPADRAADFDRMWRDNYVSSLAAGDSWERIESPAEGAHCAYGGWGWRADGG
jgi:hypothetical protein